MSLRRPTAVSGRVAFRAPVHLLVIPAAAGTHLSTAPSPDGWVPAFAGTTIQARRLGREPKPGVVVTFGENSGRPRDRRMKLVDLLLGRKLANREGEAEKITTL